MKRNSCPAVAALAAVACLCFATQASAGTVSYLELTPNRGESVLLSDLISGQIPGIQVGDKLFDRFNYTATGDMPPADRVSVLAITDADDNYGISFQGAFLDLVDVGRQLASDAGIRFEVSVEESFAERGYRISDVHLFASGVGNFSLAGPGAFISVDENFTGSRPITTAGLTAFASNSGVGGIQLEDSVVFDALYTRLRVQKDIVAFSTPEGQLPARFTIIDQTFSQEIIPEPASWALFGMAMVSLVVAARRREGVV